MDSSLLLDRRIQLIRRLLNEASKRTEKFCSMSRLSCLPGCVSCCMKKDIMTSSLEFFPLAYDLYTEGKAEMVYDRMTGLGKDAPCFFFSPIGKIGGCRRYKDRGLICRLFGFSSDTDKNNCPRLICCKGIKRSTAYECLSSSELDKSPKFTDFYLRLEAIDFPLANEELQINDAIHKALEIVLNEESLSRHLIPA